MLGDKVKNRRKRSSPELTKDKALPLRIASEAYHDSGIAPVQAPVLPPAAAKAAAGGRDKRKAAKQKRADIEALPSSSIETVQSKPTGQLLLTYQAPRMLPISTRAGSGVIITTNRQEGGRQVALVEQAAAEHHAVQGQVPKKNDLSQKQQQQNQAQQIKKVLDAYMDFFNHIFRKVSDQPSPVIALPMEL
jgi:hypothetical protein